MMIKGWQMFSWSRQSRLADAYAQVFAGAQGQMVLKDILDQAGFFEVSPPDGPLEFDNGKRVIAHHILNKVTLDHDMRIGLANAAFEEQQKGPEHE